MTEALTPRTDCSRKARRLPTSPEAAAGSGKDEGVRQLAVAAAVYSVLTALAYRRPATGRRALGIFFAVMGLGVNGSFTVIAPEGFSTMARGAPWGWYRTIGCRLTEPAPRVFGAAMALGETALAAAILSRGPVARLGLLGAAAFSLGITPLGKYTLANPVLAAGALRLAGRPWPTAAFQPAEHP
jgi:hypothetical protein